MRSVLVNFKMLLHYIQCICSRWSSPPYCWKQKSRSFPSSKNVSFVCQGDVKLNHCNYEEPQNTKFYLSTEWNICIITYFLIESKKSSMIPHYYINQSVQFSHSVMSDSLRPHESQHTRPPCPSPTPKVYSNSCLLSRWCHTAISSSVIPFSSCPQSIPASVSFQMSQLFASGGQSIGVSASASVLPMNTQDWSALGWTGWISLQSKELSRVFSKTTVQKHQFFVAQLSSYSNFHIHTWPLEKP